MHFYNEILLISEKATGHFYKYTSNAIYFLAPFVLCIRNGDYDILTGYFVYLYIGQ